MRIIALILGLLCGWSAHAQQQGQLLIDSLEKALVRQSDDTNKVWTYVRLTRAMDVVDPRKGFPYASQGMQLAEKLSWQRGIASLNNSLGLLTGDTGDNPQARVYFEKSLAINKTLDSKPNMIANLSNIGRTYGREGEFTKASDYYFQALVMAERVGNDEQAALVGTNILSMYIEEKDYQKATAYVDSTIRWGTAAHAYIHVAKAYEMMGIVYVETKDTPAARKVYDTAMAIYRRLGNQLALVGALSNLATFETDLQKSIDITLKAQAIIDTVAPSSQNSLFNLLTLGHDYLQLGENKQGRRRDQDWAFSARYLARADSLSKRTGEISYQPDIQASLANLAEDRGDYKTALVHYKRQAFLNDSIFSQDSKNKIAKLESQRAIDLKNKEIENKGLQISNQRKTLWILVIGVTLLGLVGMTLWRQSVLRKQTNEELVRLNVELHEANKVKAKFLGILSHDLRSPIARLLNFLQLQRKKPDSLTAAEKEEYWAKIGGSASALLETMEAMLLWSKGQMEIFQPRMTPVKIKGLFERLRWFFDGVDGISFEFVGAEDYVVETDEDYLWTIMQNLTANAVRELETAEGGKVVWKTWRKEDTVFCAIADNGRGTSDEQLRALYDQTVGAGARHGLGLHIIRDLAKAIDCKITIHSKKGQGTEFILTVGKAV